MPVDSVSLTQELVRCASVTPLDAGAQDVLIGALEPLGFICTRLKFGNIENVFARRGTGKPHLCFAGHTDVVPPGDESRWRYPPFSAELRDDVIHGRGTADMKGNIAAFIAAVASFQNDNGSISLLITGDEEGPAINGTIKVLEWMAQNGHIPDACIVGEPSNPNRIGEEIKIGRRGSLSGAITVRGVQGHVAYPQRAINSVHILARMINALSTVKLDEGTPYFEPTSLQFTNIDVGNTVGNIIPGQASAQFNIRYNDLWTAQKLEETVRASLDVVSQDYTLAFTHGAECFRTESGPFTELVQNAIKDVTGSVPELSTGGGTSDARFVFPYCPVVECGLINKTIHQVDEHIAVEDLKKLEEIYGRILQRFFA